MIPDEEVEAGGEGRAGERSLMNMQRGWRHRQRGEDVRKLEGHADVIKEGHAYPASDFTGSEIPPNSKSCH